ncbi:MAG: SRPBCC family protein [Devosia nanyangense]|uniref:SRPBCC family protein n=1 Tax=Devosia nanyangense TaxID=1228055 RepID=A0A933NYM2_9HYPH|nr:SRPBCC family protein [Devosia nanyangense]
MSFDLAAHMNAMTRVVRNLERDGKPAKAVVASCVYDTDAADLWDALTSKERLPRWFLPVSGELKLGGRYQFEGNAGGTITECEPRRRIAATWEFGGGTTWVNVTLTPAGQGTRLELEHIAHVDPRWGQFGPGAVGVGWDMGFMGLGRHIAEPVAAVAAEGMAWIAGAEGKDYIRQASAAWGEAAIAGGDSLDAARTAAEATRKAYSGEA